MEKVTMFKSFDGEVFAEERDCINHESKKRKDNIVNELGIEEFYCYFLEDIGIKRLWAVNIKDGNDAEHLEKYLKSTGLALEHYLEPGKYILVFIYGFVVVFDFKVTDHTLLNVMALYDFLKNNKGMSHEKD